MPSDSDRGRLPFEPRNHKKNKSKQVKDTSPVKSQDQPKKTNQPRKSRPNANQTPIPDVVSKRMGRRMAVFCGIPSILGMSSLLIFYWLKIKEVIDLPPYVALAVSFGFLGLGVLGLSYGLFSACWDEDRVGSLMGFEELKINLSRTKEAWKASKKAKAE